MGHCAGAICFAESGRGDLVQGFLMQHFKGSPELAESAAIRQLRTTAAPAIAVEVSSVALEKRARIWNKWLRELLTQSHAAPRHFARLT